MTEIISLIFARLQSQEREERRQSQNAINARFIKGTVLG
jgi:hypothetical protein